ncbi:MAG TPA: hypothetical protein VGZ24_08795 [Chthoniobacterales bacterium]|nr:hypothetical protein [Chthoniobacterales bacterium]
MTSIELADGRVRPTGGQGTARSTFALSTAKRLQFVLVPTLNGVENLPE